MPKPSTRPPLPSKFIVKKTSGKAAAAKAPVSALAIKAKADMEKRLPDLQATVESLTVTTQEEYQQADAILNMIQTARGDWKVRFYGGQVAGKTYDPIIPPMKSALDALYALVREIDKPLETMEAAVKKLQGDYKLEEMRVAREVEREKEQQRLLLEQKKRELEAKAAKPMRPAAAQALAAQIEQLDIETEEVESQGVEFVQAESSSARFTRVWTHDDIKATVKAVVAGAIPWDVLTLDAKAVDAHYKDDPETVEAWPGFGGKDAVTIAGRKSR